MCVSPSEQGCATVRCASKETCRQDTVARPQFVRRPTNETQSYRVASHFYRAQAFHHTVSLQVLPQAVHDAVLDAAARPVRRLISAGSGVRGLRYALRGVVISRGVRHRVELQFRALTLRGRPPRPPVTDGLRRELKVSVLTHTSHSGAQ